MRSTRPKLVNWKSSMIEKSKIRFALHFSFWPLESHSFGLKYGHFIYHQQRKCPNSKNYFATAHCRLVFVFNESETFHKTKFHQNKSFYHREFLKYETFQFRFHFYGECSSMATSKWVVIPYHEAKINIGTTWKMADVVL